MAPNLFCCNDFAVSHGRMLPSARFSFRHLSTYNRAMRYHRLSYALFLTAWMFCAASLYAQQITRNFFALDMNKTSHVGGQQSPWPNECCRSGSLTVDFGVWRSLGAQVNWDQIAVGSNFHGANCPPRRGADPQDPCYRWERLDGYLRQAAAHHQEVIYTVTDTPNFANGNTSSEFPPSDVDGNDQYLKDFITAAYRHVTANGWHIKYWECWNEPDVRNEYKGSMQQLANMCRDIHNTIKALDSSAQVISPPFTSTAILGYRRVIDSERCSDDDCSLMQRYLAAGGSQYADIIGYHGYAFPDPVDPLFDSKLPRESIRVNVPDLVNAVNAIVRRTGNQGKPIWMTEGGDDLPPTSQDALSNDDRHAAFVGRYLLQFMGRGTSLITWYGWDFGGPHALLANHTGIPDDRLNKGGLAFREIYDWTVGRGATMVRACTPRDTIYTCTLKDSKGKTMLAMYDTSKDCSGSSACEITMQRVPAEFTQWTDLEGGVHPISGGMAPIGRKPILLEAVTTKSR